MSPRQRTLNTLIRGRAEFEIGLHELIGDSLNPRGVAAREALLKPILALIDETIRRVDEWDWGHK